MKLILANIYAFGYICMYNIDICVCVCVYFLDFLLMFLYLALIDWMERSTILACSSFSAIVNKGNIEETILGNLMYVYNCMFCLFGSNWCCCDLCGFASVLYQSIYRSVLVFVCMSHSGI